ncbi:MAG: radical SAM protein [Sedimentisphaerales bacterium]|nr:radical SAM protein [Sedimentisphaerales bacterium]
MRRTRSQNPKSVCIAYANGCPRSQMDTAWLFAYFGANGWKVVSRPEKADLIIATACAFDTTAEEESIARLAILKNKVGDTPFIVMGCLAGINPRRVSDELGAIVVSPADISRLDQLTSAVRSLADVPAVNDTQALVRAATRCWRFDEYHPGASRLEVVRREIRQRVKSLSCRLGLDGPAGRLFFRRKSRGPAEPLFRIRVARGCLEECTYCAIRVAAGTLRSKSLDGVLAEFDRGVSQGYSRFELLAEDLGPYGTDIGTSLPILLARLFSRQGSFKVTFTDINGRYVIKYTKELAALLGANSQRIERLRVPVQSGSDRILDLMRRQYTAADAEHSLRSLLEAAPSLPLETHILVGFPGETDEDFRATVDLLRAVAFTRIQLYVYSDRPGTPASEFGRKVPLTVKAERLGHLLKEFPQGVPCSASNSMLKQVKTV